MNKNAYQEMLEKVQKFHDKHDFKNNGGEDYPRSHAQRGNEGKSLFHTQWLLWVLQTTEMGI